MQIRLVPAACVLATVAGCDAGSPPTPMDTQGVIAAFFTCDVPATPPSGGSCVSVVDAGAGAGPDAGAFGIACNPVTNGPCLAGQTCDTTADTSGHVTGFACFGGPNQAQLCSPCDTASGPFCAGGLSCASVSGSLSACTRFCCTDADCGAGHCTITDTIGTPLSFSTLAPNLGICGK
jgi:hypothetical protein